ncbi:hypothetical protein V6Z11_D08G058400 [Gossypium hirsutum]
MLSQTFNNHCMCCHVPFSCNKLKSTRRKVPRQICRIPSECANWSPYSTAVASAITTNRTRKSRIDVNFHLPLRRGHLFYHGSWFRML